MPDSPGCCRFRQYDRKKLIRDLQNRDVERDFLHTQ